MTIQEHDLDLGAVEAFAQQLGGAFVASVTTSMVALGYRLGLFEAAALGPATSAELAERTGLQERYVREWLGSVTVAGIFTYDPTTATYELPAEHAVVLTGDGATNLAPTAGLPVFLAGFVDPIAEVFRTGGGLSYEHYRPGFTDLMDDLNRRTYDEALVSTYVPLAEGLHERLTGGIRVGDIGTGSGHPVNVLGAAYPASTFVGFDIAEDAIAAGQAEAAAHGLDNVRFSVQDVAALQEVGTFDALFAFDAIHDQADPARVLANIRRALHDDGVFVMVDIRASSNLEDNCSNPLTAMLYGVSLLHCMTVSLACDGAGLGAVWGEQVACEMLRAAGFGRIEVHEIPQDPFNLVYVCRP
jgi:2-polyprenyl-3-methyl-5-hydroxy-6-metoxy-1,4-benzoquinol methylase